MRNLTILVAAAILALAIYSHAPGRYQTMSEPMVLDTKTGNILMANGAAYILDGTRYSYQAAKGE